MNLLSEIDDEHIIILMRHLRRNIRNEEFFEKHRQLFFSPPVTLGCSQEELEKSTVYKLSYSHLVKLGLLQEIFPRAESELELDRDTGKLKVMGYKLSPLGRLLLVKIGVAEPGEF
ncbi:MAG: hypothetical protein LBE75_07785 [Burkholderiales bacterium]|nr:hypothetical protein [Burkholderiales bacterium]